MSSALHTLDTPCPDCGKSDQVTFGQNAHGTWIGCIRCQNARDGYPNVPAALDAWRRLTAKGGGS